MAWSLTLDLADMRRTATVLVRAADKRRALHLQVAAAIATGLAIGFIGGLMVL